MMELMWCVVVVGVGKMGEILIQGMFDGGVLQSVIVVMVVYQEWFDVIVECFGVVMMFDNCEVVKNVEILLFCVKLQVVECVLVQVYDFFFEGVVFVLIFVLVMIGYFE